MISKYTYKKLTWIDLDSPTHDELHEVAETYQLPSLVAEELRLPIFRSKVDRYQDFIYLVLHFPVFTKGAKKHYQQEVDFVIGKNYVITTHYEPVDALNEFSKLFEINSALDRGMESAHAGFLFFYIIEQMYHSVSIELEMINDSLHDIEHHIFEGKEGEMVSAISGLNRTLVDFKQAVRFHGETLTSLEHAGTEFFGAPFAYYLSVITGEYRKIQKTIDDHKEILRDLRETNDSLLTAKTNDIITKLTIMNFIMLPLGLISWIFGMTSSFPLVQSVNELWMIIGGMIFVGLVMFTYFRSKKWL